MVGDDGKSRLGRRVIVLQLARGLPPGPSAVITVRDDGPGIAAEDLPHIFDRFFKCGGERGKSGSGLGLAIARENALGLRERIWAESSPGAASAFRFTIRLK